MTVNDPTSSLPDAEEPAAPASAEPAAPASVEPAAPAEDPGYLTETGQAVGEDGSVVPIIGGLPAAEGSAWDIGAPLDERGAGLAEELGGGPGQAEEPGGASGQTEEPDGASGQADPEDPRSF